jgi:hypothetical protein
MIPMMALLPVGFDISSWIIPPDPKYGLLEVLLSLKNVG